MAEVAVVTGGASGFGLAVAEGCAQRGMDVALLDLDGERVRTEGDALAARHGVEVLAMRVERIDPGLGIEAMMRLRSTKPGKVSPSLVSSSLWARTPLMAMKPILFITSRPPGELKFRL